MGTNDLKISAAIRRELSSRRVDLSKLKFPVKSGEVTLEGEISFVGLDKTNDEIAIELKFIESSIKSVDGVSKITFELTNWKKNDSGIWEPVGSSSTTTSSFNGEGLVCPECDFVIRFCPCCGKPLVAGAKPGMHKNASQSMPKPIARKPGLPPIKPIIRKPRPIGSPIASPISPLKSGSLSTSSGVAPKSPINLTKPEATKSDLPTTETPKVEKKISLTKKEDTEVKKESKPVVNTESLVDTTLQEKQVNVTDNAKPVVSATPIPLKPLKPLKPLAGLKPIKKPESTTAKTLETVPSAPSNIEANITSPSIIQQNNITNDSNNISTANNESSINLGIQNQNSSLNGTSTDNTGFATDIPIPDFMKDNTANTSSPNNNLDLGLGLGSLDSNLNTPSPNQTSDLGLGLGSLDSNLNTPAQNQVPNLGLGLGSLDSNLNTPAPNQTTDFGLGLGSLDSNLNTPAPNQTPDLGLGLGSLDSNLNIPAPNQTPDLGLGLGSFDSNLNTPAPNQTPDFGLGSFDSNLNTPSSENIPDLDLGLGFNLGADIPTTPTPSSLSDLGLNTPTSNEAPSIPNLDMNFGMPDLSGNIPNTPINQPTGNMGQNSFAQNAPNTPNNSNPTDLFGNMNLDELGGNNASQNNYNDPFATLNQPFNDTPLPPTKNNQPAQNQASELSFDNFGDDTPLPPMRPAQSSAPKKAPAKKKSDDLFASLFNNSSNGGADGLGNLDLDNFEILSTGDSDSSSVPTSNPSAPQQSDSNPFNLGNVLDLDNMMGSGQKDSTGTFNLDDFDINNFKL